MIASELSTSDPRIAAALDELRQLIVDRYPTAVFTVGRGYDPAGIYLTATVDVDDADDVTSTFIDRLLELQIEDELPVYVIPVELETAERIKVRRSARSLPFAAPDLRL